MTQASSASADTERDALRVPVWLALSDLYLDTDVTMSYDYIVRTLAASPFSLDELHEMLMYDVHPVLYSNLMSMAGEWGCFDEAWLTERVLAVREQPRWRRRFTQWFVRDIGTQWRTLAPMIQAARGAATQS